MEAERREEPATARAPAGLAGFWWRAAAFSIDIFTIWVVVVILTAVIARDAVTAAAGSPEAEAATTRLLIASWTFQGAFYWWANSVGWSPGKRLLGLRIVRADGAPPGARRGLIRTLGMFVSATPFLLGFAWAAWDRGRQTWHDKMAGTYVVRPAPLDERFEGM